MNTQCAPSALSQHFEIAARLRSFHNSKRVLLFWHLEIRSIVAGYLQEHARVWPTFIRLTSRMKKSRPESQARRDAFRITNNVPRSLQKLLVCIIHLDISKQREIVIHPQSIEMSPQIVLQGFGINRGFQSSRVRLVRIQLDTLAFKKRSLLGQRTRLFILLRQFSRGDLASFHVRLIERIDPDDRAGDRRREFPTKEFLAQIVNVIEPD